MENLKLTLVILILIFIVVLNKTNKIKVDYFNDNISYLSDLANLAEIDKNINKIVELECGGNYKLEKNGRDILEIKQKDYLKLIIQPLINEINKRTGLLFYFLEYEDITKQSFDDGVDRLIIDFFLYEANNHYNRRMIVDLSINKNKIKINNLNIANAEINNNKGEHSEQLFNQTIINDENLKYNNEIIGVNDGSLEFSKTNIKNKIYPSRNFRIWIKHPNNKQTNTWPCRLEGHWWDKDSVMNTELQSKKCTGINNTYRYPSNNPKFLPNFKNKDIENKQNWLFEEHKVDGQHTI